MNRRAFLKLFVGTAVVATIPIPKFLIPEPPQNPFSTYGSPNSFSATGSTLTVEMIEEAAAKSAMNMGAPDIMIMAEEDFENLRKWYQPGYEIVYA